MRYFSPFESNYRPESGWRWYWKFLREYPHMAAEVESDTFDCLAARGLVMC